MIMNEIPFEVGGKKGRVIYVTFAFFYNFPAQFVSCYHIICIFEYKSKETERNQRWTRRLQRGLRHGGRKGRERTRQLINV